MSLATPAQRIDPGARRDLEALLALGAPGAFWPADLAERRRFFLELQEVEDAVGHTAADVDHHDREIPGPPGAPPVRVRVLRPTRAPAVALPAVLSIHGGGFTFGSVETDHALAAQLALAVEAVVVSVDYRLAPEHPHPAPVLDCFAALEWLAGQAGELDVDPDRIAVFGASAGGGLAAAVALMARDRGGPALALQALAYPMLDDRDATASMRDLPDFGPWNRDVNNEGFRCLLAGAAPDAYAAPARASDLSGLPPTYVDVGELDILRDESLDYAARLLRAGVPTELHVFAAAYHATEQISPESELGRRITATRMTALRRALAKQAG